MKCIHYSVAQPESKNPVIPGKIYYHIACYDAELKGSGFRAGDGKTVRLDKVNCLACLQVASKVGKRK